MRINVRQSAIILSVAAMVFAANADNIGWRSTGEVNFPGTPDDWGREYGTTLLELGRMPATNDAVKIGRNLPGNAVLRMTNDWRNAFYIFEFNTPANGILDFDGRGYGIYPPATAIDTYYVEAFHLRNANNSHIFSVENYGITGSCKREPSFTAVNPQVKAWYTSNDKTSHFVIGGNFNFYDPVGEWYSSRNTMVCSAQANSDIVFSNATLRIGKINFNGVNETADRPLYRNLAFDHSTLETMTTPVFPYVTATANQKSDTFMNLSFNDATWLQRGTTGLNISQANSGLEHLVLAATNSLIETWGELSYQNQANGRFKDSTLVYHGAVYCYLRNEADMYVEGGSFTNALFCVGDQRSWSRAVFNGGDHYPQTFYIGANGHGAGTVIVTNSAAFTTLRNEVKIGYAGTGVCEVVSNSRFTVNDILSLGTAANGYGILRVKDGGYVTGTGTQGRELKVGVSGEGHLEIDGGDVEASYAAIGYSERAASESSMSIRNGSLSLYPATGTYGVLTLARAAHHALLTLGEGSVIRCAAIRGATAGYSSFISDGGTIVANSVNSTYPILGGIDSAKIGVGGLTVDSDGYNLDFTQNLVNADAADGVFVKKGVGLLSVSSPTWNVARTEVRGGTFLYVNAAPTTFATSLDIQDGTFSTFGVTTALTVGDLVVTNGTIALDPGDVITVTGDVSLKNLVLNLSSIPDEAVAAFVFTSPLSADAVSAFAKTLSGTGIPDGRHVKVTLSTENDVTTAMVEVVDDNPVGEGDTLTWHGTDSNWASASNWDPSAVPAVGKKAAFTDANAVKSVTVPSGAKATALEFADNGYLLSGAKLTLDGEPGKVRLGATAGSHEIAAPVELGDRLEAEPSVGTEVKLSGNVTGVGIVKTGSGKLILGGENELTVGVAQHRGILTLENEKAVSSLDWRTDTVETRSEDGSAFTIDAPLVLTPSNSTAAVIFKNENDVTLNDVTLTDGCFVKRGAGRLTIPVKEGMTFAYSEGGWRYVSAGTYSTPGKLTFADDGTAPYGLTDGGYGGLSVVEGELYLKPAVPDTTPTFMAKHSFLLGARTATGTVAPTVTVDHVYCNVQMGSGVATWLGRFMTAGSGVTPFANTCTMNVINGGTVWADTIRMGENNVIACLNVDNSTAYASWTWQFEGAGTGVARIRAKDSNIRNGGGGALFQILGNVDADFDNCVVGAVNENSGQNNTWSYMHASSKAAGQLVFRNGSELRVWHMNTLSTVVNPLKFVFDDASWGVNFGKVDRDFVFSNAWVSASVAFEMRGRGMILKPTAGHIYTMEFPLSGNGGFVNAGAGTVKFASGSYGFTGKLVAESGVIDLSEAGTIEGATIGGGAGTIKSGAFHDATIALDEVGGSVPNFENCTFTGTTRVTIGGEPARFNDVVIANYAGTISGVDTFRLKGWNGYSGKFTASDGKVYADLGQFGFMLIMR